MLSLPRVDTLTDTYLTLTKIIEYVNFLSDGIRIEVERVVTGNPIYHFSQRVYKYLIYSSRHNRSVVRRDGLPKRQFPYMTLRLKSSRVRARAS